MELDGIHLTYFSNLFAKGKITLEQLEVRRQTSKSEKTLTYRDWVIDFLKSQVILRDGILEEQSVLLDMHEVENNCDYEG